MNVLNGFGGYRSLAELASQPMRAPFRVASPPVRTICSRESLKQAFSIAEAEVVNKDVYISETFPGMMSELIATASGASLAAELVDMLYTAAVERPATCPDYATLLRESYLVYELLAYGLVTSDYIRSRTRPVNCFGRTLSMTLKIHRIAEFVQVHRYFFESEICKILYKVEVPTNLIHLVKLLELFLMFENTQVNRHELITHLISMLVILDPPLQERESSHIKNLLVTLFGGHTTCTTFLVCLLETSTNNSYSPLAGERPSPAGNGAPGVSDDLIRSLLSLLYECTDETISAEKKVSTATDKDRDKHKEERDKEKQREKSCAGDQPRKRRRYSQTLEDDEAAFEILSSTDEDAINNEYGGTPSTAVSSVDRAAFEHYGIKVLDSPRADDQTASDHVSSAREFNHAIEEEDELEDAPQSQEAHLSDETSSGNERDYELRHLDDFFSNESGPVPFLSRELSPEDSDDADFCPYKQRAPPIAADSIEEPSSDYKSLSVHLKDDDSPLASTSCGDGFFSIEGSRASADLRSSLPVADQAMGVVIINGTLERPNALGCIIVHGLITRYVAAEGCAIINGNLETISCWSGDDASETCASRCERDVETQTRRVCFVAEPVHARVLERPLPRGMRMRKTRKVRLPSVTLVSSTGSVNNLSDLLKRVAEACTRVTPTNTLLHRFLHDMWMWPALALLLTGGNSWKQKMTRTRQRPRRTTGRYVCYVTRRRRKRCTGGVTSGVGPSLEATLNAATFIQAAMKAEATDAFMTRALPLVDGLFIYASRIYMRARHREKVRVRWSDGQLVSVSRIGVVLDVCLAIMLRSFSAPKPVVRFVRPQVLKALTRVLVGNATVIIRSRALQILKRCLMLSRRNLRTATWLMETDVLALSAFFASLEDPAAADSRLHETICCCLSYLHAVANCIEIYTGTPPLGIQLLHANLMHIEAVWGACIQRRITEKFTPPRRPLPLPAAPTH